MTKTYQQLRIIVLMGVLTMVMCCLAALVMSSSVMAGEQRIDAGKVGIPEVSANNVIEGVLNTVYSIAGVASIIVIIIGGVLYTISDGDSEKVKRAKNAILYAVVGLVVVMMAFVITGFVIGRF